MKTLLYISLAINIILGVYLALQTANNDNEQMIARHQIDSLNERNHDTIAKLDTLYLTTEKRITNIKLKYDTIYLTLDTLNLDSTHKLFLTIYQ